MSPDPQNEHFGAVVIPVITSEQKYTNVGIMGRNQLTYLDEILLRCWFQVFLNTGKYGSEKAPYLDTFNAMHGTVIKTRITCKKIPL